MARLGKYHEIVRLSITLRYVEPKVSRRIDVFANTNLDDLHCCIQAAMGWKDCHLWGFEATRYGQVVEWFADGSNSPFGEPRLDTDITILDVIYFLQGKPEFTYIYDYGDSWTHKIHIGKIQPTHKDRQYPFLVSGRGRCPPENIGGAWGYSDFLAAFDDPSSEYREYYPFYFDGSEIWDPEDAELDRRRVSLAHLR